jgi:hypothetical protein
MYGSDEKKRLLELLKSEQGKTAIRSLFESLHKSIELTKQASGNSSGERGVNDDATQNISFADGESASEESQKDFPQESHEHFLTDSIPHHEHHKKPWLVFKAGSGSQAGQPINNGNPLTPHEVTQLIQSDEHNPHELFVRPAFKHQPWRRLKDHPNFSGFLSNHIAKVREQHWKNPSFQNNETPASLVERHVDKGTNHLNPQELKWLGHTK